MGQDKIIQRLQTSPNSESRYMAELFTNQAEVYAKARPTYPKEWFAKLASLTAHHNRAWDAGTGNGQAAIAVAEHYDHVVATDVSEAQLRYAFLHPKVRYVHTPLSLTEDELVSLLGGDNSVDLVTVATAVHYFDLPSFYSVINRVLRKPGGVIAVWTYNYELRPLEDLMRRIQSSALPYTDPRARYAFERYETLPFPFESVGMGSEGHPVTLEMERELAHDELVAWLTTSSAVAAAKAQGVDLVSEEVVRDFKAIWGGADSGEKKKISFKAFMLVGEPIHAGKPADT